MSHWASNPSLLLLLLLPFFFTFSFFVLHLSPFLLFLLKPFVTITSAIFSVRTPQPLLSLISSPAAWEVTKTPLAEGNKGRAEQISRFLVTYAVNYSVTWGVSSLRLSTRHASLFFLFHTHFHHHHHLSLPLPSLPTNTLPESLLARSSTTTSPSHYLPFLLTHSQKMFNLFWQFKFFSFLFFLPYRHIFGILCLHYLLLPQAYFKVISSL